MYSLQQLSQQQVPYWFQALEVFYEEQAPSGV